MDTYDFRGAYKPTGGRVGVRTGGAGRKRCTKGKSCGATCISAKKECWVDLPGGKPGSNGGRNLHDSTSKVRDLVKARAGKGESVIPQPKPQPKPQPTPQPKPQPQPQTRTEAQKAAADLKRQRQKEREAKIAEKAKAAIGRDLEARIPKQSPQQPTPQPQPRLKPAPQPEQKAVQEKKEGAYTPKASNDPKGTKSERMRHPVAKQETDTFEPENLRRKAAAVKADGNLSETARNKQVRDLERRAAQAEQNKEFLSKLEKNLPAGTKVEVYSGVINMSTKTKSGDDVKVSYSPQQGFHFKVNNSLDTGSVADRRAQMEVASAVRKQYDALVQSLPVGAIVATSAHSSDGKGAGRQRLYERMGFSSNIGIGNGLYAQKQPDGSMAPAGNNPKAAERAYESQSNNPNSLWFSEKKKPSEGEQDDMWRALIFGD